MTSKISAPFYFSHFHCVGGDCIDTCCQRWEVKVDRAHYEALKARIAGDRGAEARFSQYVTPNREPSASDRNYAVMTMAEDGRCPMLDEEGLCRIHREYGVDCLWNTCRIYPRVVSKLGEEFEVIGAPSCPEVMRLCLLEDDPYAMVDLSLEEALGGDEILPVRELAVEDGAYAAGFHTVREAMLGIIADEGRGHEGRLYQLASLAQAIGGFYYRRCPEFDPQRLSTAIEASIAPANAERCDRFMADYRPSEPLGLIVALSTLEIFQQQDSVSPSSRLYAGIKAVYHQAQGAEFPDSAVFAEAIRRRRGEIGAEFMGRLERGVGRYLGNCLMREWFTDMPDPISYLQMLLVRCAILRFLLLLHPALPSVTDTAGMDALLVDVIHAFSRDIDHSQSLLRIIFSALAEQQMLDYAYSPAFIRL